MIEKKSLRSATTTHLSENSNNVFTTRRRVYDCYKGNVQKVYKSQFFVYTQWNSVKKVGFWNVVKRCYCSEIMDMDLHVDKMTKITHWCLKKKLYCKGKWDKKSTKHISSFVLLITISQCTAQSPLKGHFISVFPSPLSVHATTHLKVVRSKWLKLYPPHLYCPASGLLLMEKKNKKNLYIRWSFFTKEEAISLFNRSYFLPLHTHNPLPRSPVAVCALRSPSPVSVTASSFSLLLSSSPKHSFCTNIPSLCSFTLLYTSSPF